MMVRPLILTIFAAGVAASPASADPHDHWAFRPVERPAVPRTASAWARNPIDQFILAGLEAEGLRPAPEADRATLLRRLKFDLLGLPPTPEEIDAFVSDPDRPTPTNAWSSATSPRRTSASAGRGTGSTWSASPRATASR